MTHAFTRDTARAVSPVEVSVVMPMYNEAAAAALTVPRVAEQLSSCVTSYEIVCVDDGSTDGTTKLVDQLAQADRHVMPVHLSRNFGKEAALAAGIDAARGRAVIVIDADLQHPPTLIPRMVDVWRDGADIVEAQKRTRGRENPIYRLFTRVFYQLLGSRASGDFDGSSDYKLLDRQVVDALRCLPERARFFRGLIAWVGFERARIAFDVQERVGGTSKWTRSKLLRYAVNNVFAFSTVPLIATAWMGVLATGFAIVLAVDTLANYLLHRAVSGFTTVIIAIAFFAGLTLLGLGIVAAYLARVLEEVKARPIYVVRRDVRTRPTTGPAQGEGGA